MLVIRRLLLRPLCSSCDEGVESVFSVLQYWLSGSFVGEQLVSLRLVQLFNALVEAKLMLQTSCAAHSTSSLPKSASLPHSNCTCKFLSPQSTLCKLGPPPPPPSPPQLPSTRDRLQRTILQVTRDVRAIVVHLVSQARSYANRVTCPRRLQQHRLPEP